MHLVWKGLRVPLWLAAASTVAAYLYVTVVFGWFVARLRFGDRWGWLILLNTLALCLFLPLPLILLAALFLKRVDLWIITGAVLALGLFLYSSLFVPRLQPAKSEHKRLVAMTYNLLFTNTHTTGVVAALRASNADVIGLQELSVSVASAIKHDLRDVYPYQLLDGRTDYSGMGLLSRYPLRATGQTLGGNWLGTPQIATLDFEGTPVTVINLHTISIRINSGDWSEALESSSREREQEAQLVIDFAAAHPGPLIVLGDFNTTDLSTAHRLLTSRLYDSWLEGGYGLGLTFPSGNTPKSAGITVKGISVPTWLVRIDYIFHSNALRTFSARIGPWDRYSDHRSVIAELTVKK